MDKKTDLQSVLRSAHQQISTDLDKCVFFWTNNSHDSEYGGFFNCLNSDGKVYDDKKYCWMQGRQVWMYARLYNEVTRFHKQELLQAATQGAKFLMNHAKNPETWKCYFSLTRDGKPIKIQRTIFSECFYVLAMSEMYSATKEQLYKDEALTMYKNIIYWVKTDSSVLGRPKLSGSPAVNSLATPMMILSLIDQLIYMDQSFEPQLAEMQQWCKDQILAHVQRNNTVVLETVSADGKELSGSEGRLQNPGHIIEGGWFLLQLAMRTQDRNLAKTAIDMFIKYPMRRGWDEEHGGLFHFLDVDGWSPVQLEWNMKLWWPHCEALISLLMAYTYTKDESFINDFQKVLDYSYQKFVDKEDGEWLGYLNQEGRSASSIKGGPFKGCFHVPRALMMCEEMLDKLLKN